MPVLAVYNQTFTTSESSVFTWSFQFARIMKTKQSSRFVIKVNFVSNATTSIVPAIALNQLVQYISSPELCANANNYILTPTGIVINNKVALNSGLSHPLIFVCNQFPLNPVVINSEFTTTQLPPTSGTQVFTIGFTIYEIDGDIPDEVIY